jgi:hypothetical protein
LIIRIALLLFASALAVFLLADILLRLSIPLLPATIDTLGIALLFGAFGLILTTGLLLIAQLTTQAILKYFSNHQRMQRRLLYITQKQHEINRLFHLRTDKIRYLAELKRKRLLYKNNKNHLRRLSKAINRDLLAIRKHLSDSQFKQLHADCMRFKNDQNSDALLKLQQHIASLTKV